MFLGVATEKEIRHQSNFSFHSWEQNKEHLPFLSTLVENVTRLYKE
jgi:hypothetical protein